MEDNRRMTNNQTKTSMSNGAARPMTRPAGKPATDRPTAGKPAGKKFTTAKLKALLAMVAFVIIALAAAGLTTVGTLDYLAFNVAVPAQQAAHQPAAVGAVSMAPADTAQQSQ